MTWYEYDFSNSPVQARETSVERIGTWIPEALEIALDYFIVSSWTYNDVTGSHVGWLLPNVNH